MPERLIQSIRRIIFLHADCNLIIRLKQEKPITKKLVFYN